MVLGGRDFRKQSCLLLLACLQKRRSVHRSRKFVDRRQAFAPGSLVFREKRFGDGAVDICGYPGLVRAGRVFIGRDDQFGQRIEQRKLIVGEEKRSVRLGRRKLQRGECSGRKSLEQIAAIRG